MDRKLLRGCGLHPPAARVLQVVLSHRLQELGQRLPHSDFRGRRAGQPVDRHRGQRAQLLRRRQGQLHTCLAPQRPAEHLVQQHPVPESLPRQTVGRDIQQGHRRAGPENPAAASLRKKRPAELAREQRYLRHLYRPPQHNVDRLLERRLGLCARDRRIPHLRPHQRLVHQRHPRGQQRLHLVHDLQ